MFANVRERSVIQPITARHLANVRGRSRTKQLTELTADHHVGCDYTHSEFMELCRAFSLAFVFANDRERSVI